MIPDQSACDVVMRVKLCPPIPAYIGVLAPLSSKFSSQPHHGQTIET